MPRPLILAAHGSESSQGRASLARFVNVVRRAVRGSDVHDAFLDVEEPLVDEVVAGIAGPRSVVPLMLHAEPAARGLLRGVAATDPFVTVTPPLGPDWVLAEVGVRRLIEAGARPEDSILLAADTAADLHAVEEVGRAARFLSAVWGGRVHVGTLSGPDTSLSDAVDIARAYGGRVVIASYLLTTGRAHETFQLSEADVVTEPLLDSGVPDQRLVELVLARLHARTADVADL